MSDDWKPDDCTAVTPYLVVPDALAEIAFIKDVFDAEQTLKLDMPDGSVAHAEVKISGATVMIGQAGGPHKPLSAMIVVYVPDADATVKRAVAAGATIVQELTDTFYGARVGTVKDANGINWSIHTQKEHLTEAQLKARMMQAPA